MRCLITYLVLAIAFVNVAIAGNSCEVGGVKGVCKHKKDCPAKTHFTDPGHCPGSKDIMCCTASKCRHNVSGKCLNTYNGCPGGSFVGGHCPGGGTVKCCHPGPKSPSNPKPPTPQCPKVKQVKNEYYYSRKLTGQISNGFNVGFDVGAMICSVLPAPAVPACAGAIGGVYVWKWKFNECASKKKCFMLGRNSFGVYIPHCSGNGNCC